MQEFQFQTDENNIIFKRAKEFVANTNEYVYLTGKAGTGKTTFLHYIRNNISKNVVVAAPTGVAAINAGGVTLHSLFQLSLEPFVPGFKQAKHFYITKNKIDVIRKIELLIIDEVSMLRADVLDAVDHVLRIVRKNQQPFGGTQVLFIGDLYQLPPVVKDPEWDLLRQHYDSPHFFSAHVIKKINLIYLELKKVYRQSEQTFIDILNNVRNNALTTTDLELLNSRYIPNFIPEKGTEYITLTTHNNQADFINRKELGKLNDIEYIIAGKITKDFPESSLPTECDLHLKVGTQVMFIKNDSEGRYYNGKIGEVSCISLKEENFNVINNIVSCNVNDIKVTVKLNDSNEEILVFPEEWENKKYVLNEETKAMEEDIVGLFKQFPLRLAWAVTIHKSQGLTFERAIIDIGRSFASGQTYVALSRCTSLEGIVLLSPLRSHNVMTDYNAKSFSRLELQEDAQQQLLIQGKQKFNKENLLRFFEWKPLYLFLKDFEDLLRDKTSDDFIEAKHILSDFEKVIKNNDAITVKFQNQLCNILILAEQNNDFLQLKERCEKAVHYFHELIVNQILIPFQFYIQNANVPKNARVYYKSLYSLESDLIFILNNYKKVCYGDLQLTNDLNLQIPSRQDIFSPDKKTKKQAAEKEKKNHKNHNNSKKEEVGETAKISLEMFKNNLTINQIAAERNLAEATIEGHLSQFVGEKISIYDIFSKQEVEELKELVFPLMQAENPVFKPIYDKCEGKFSYGKLKMAYHYLKNTDSKK